DEDEFIGTSLELEAEEVVGLFQLFWPATEDVVGVGAVLVFPVVGAEISFDGVEAEWVGETLCEDLFGGLGGLAQEAFGRWVLGGEEKELSGGMAGGCGEPTLAVAAAGGLGDGVESGDAPENDGEIDVHARFDELGGDDAHGEAGAETGFNRVEDAGAVLGAHEGAEVEVGVVALEAFEESAGVTASANDAEHLGVGLEQRDKCVVVEATKRGGAHALEGRVKAGAVGDDFDGG